MWNARLNGVGLVHASAPGLRYNYVHPDGGLSVTDGLIGHVVNRNNIFLFSLSCTRSASPTEVRHDVGEAA